MNENTQLTLVQTALTKLAHFFLWRRKDFVAIVKQFIEQLQRANAELQQKNSQSIEYINKQNLILQQEKEKSAKLEELANEAKSNIQRLIALKTHYNELKDSHEDLTRNYQQIVETKEKLSKDYAEIYQKNNLVSQLLAVTPPNNQGLRKFKSLLEKDYIAYTNQAGVISKAENYLHLSAIEQELELLIGFPDIYTKTVIGVSGGFSSGKSAFINSFMKNKDTQLAVGINPVTAIPSYVIGDSRTTIKGYANNGGAVSLSRELYIQMHHEYIKSFNFDLKKIMPFMSISVPMESEVFDGLCFIDTPGYNPANTGQTDNDKNIAVKFASQSDVLIWVIGSDSTGTIPQSDLDFIQQANFTIPIYFVLNKADLKPKEDIEAILDEIETTLDFDDIDYQGVSAYSSIQAREIDFRKQSLFDFLSTYKNKSPVTDRIYEKIDNVFDCHVKALEHQRSSTKQMETQFKSIRLDILETGNESLYEKTQTRFNELSKEMDKQDLSEILEKTEKLQIEFKQAVKTTIDEIKKIIN